MDPFSKVRGVTFVDTLIAIMVKGSKNLKRRGGAKRVRQRKKRHDIVKCVTKECREKWARGVTTGGNYAKMGLVANVNDLSAATDLVKDGAVARNGEEGEKSLGETWMEKKNAGLMEEAPRRVPFYMSEEDMAYVKPLIDRYGVDYKKMARDLKLNAMQQTPAWLKRKCTRYAKFMESKQTEGQCAQRLIKSK